MAYCCAYTRKIIQIEIKEKEITNRKEHFEYFPTEKPEMEKNFDLRKKFETDGLVLSDRLFCVETAKNGRPYFDLRTRKRCTGKVKSEFDDEQERTELESWIEKMNKKTRLRSQIDQI